MASRLNTGKTIEETIRFIQSSAQLFVFYLYRIGWHVSSARVFRAVPGNQPYFKSGLYGRSFETGVPAGQV